MTPNWLHISTKQFLRSSCLKYRPFNYKSLNLTTQRIKNRMINFHYSLIKRTIIHIMNKYPTKEYRSRLSTDSLTDANMN